jgi:glucan 1,3-beta-glucosidase
VLNEPISAELWDAIDLPNRYPSVDPEQAAGSEPVPTEFLKRFYRDAYERIRARAPDVRVVFHDGFRPEAWPGFLTAPEFENVVLDTHLYLMTHTWADGETDLAGYLSVIDDTFVRTVRDVESHVPVMIGEWCVDTAAANPAELGEEERRRYYRSIAEAQLQAWDPAVAWCYWSCKIHTDEPKLAPWDMGRAIEAGWLPAAPRG